MELSKIQSGRKKKKHIWASLCVFAFAQTQSNFMYTWDVDRMRDMAELSLDPKNHHEASSRSEMEAKN